jgi:hypothetical protein
MTWAVGSGVGLCDASSRGALRRDVSSSSLSILAGHGDLIGLRCLNGETPRQLAIGAL